MRYIVIDRCKEVDCRCLDGAGVILYDGPSREKAYASLATARYPEPEVQEIEQQHEHEHE